MKGEFLLFINYRQALRFGHVGWGFLCPGTGTYVYGSTDHLYRHQWWDLHGWIKYMHVPSGEENDWWMERSDKEEMCRLMSEKRFHIRYHAYKSIPVSRPRPEQAEAMALSYKNGGWSVLSNNCVQQSYEIARAYGVGPEILNPWRNSFLLVPNYWFGRVEGRFVKLRTPTDEL